MREERDRVREDQDRLRRSSQQLLDINRLKSEFIVNAGHGLEASLQTVLGFAEQLQQGGYGLLTGEQQQAVRNLHNWAKRMQSDIEMLIELAQPDRGGLSQRLKTDSTLLRLILECGDKSPH